MELLRNLDQGKTDEITQNFEHKWPNRFKLDVFYLLGYE